MERPPQPGDLTVRLTVERDVGTTRSPSGQHIPDWQTYACVWAKVTPLGGLETTPAGQVVALVRHAIWLRYGTHVADLGPTMRLVLRGSRRIEIQSAVIVNERGFWWFVEGIEG
jgi:SPP1 family predicted phage head-tail adaptor